MGTPQTTRVDHDPRELEQAFGVFNELSERLTTAYEQLEGRVADLTEGLARARRARPVKLP